MRRLDVSQEKENVENSEWTGDADGKVSVCGIMKDGASEIIQKLESEIPQLFQVYSDLYARYLHSIQECYGICHIAEKQYFDKLEIDNEFLKQLDSYFKSCTRITDAQIDVSAGFQRSYVQFKVGLIDSWDKYAQVWIYMYAKFLAGIVAKKA